MKHTLIAISLAFFAANCFSAPLGVFPENVRQLCAPFKGMSLSTPLSEEDKKNTVDEKFLPCLQAQVAYIQELYSQEYETALAKIKNKKKLDGIIENGGNIGAEMDYEKVKDDLEGLILYKSQLVNDLLTMEMLLAPKVKYPKSVIRACKQPVQGNPWGDICLGYKTDYLKKQIQANLKKIMASSPNPEAVKAEQKLFEDGIEEFCAGDLNSHITYSFYDSCIGNLVILHSIEVAEMAKSLSKPKTK